MYRFYSLNIFIDLDCPIAIKLIEGLSRTRFDPGIRCTMTTTNDDLPTCEHVSHIIRGRVFHLQSQKSYSYAVKLLLVEQIWSVSMECYIPKEKRSWKTWAFWIWYSQTPKSVSNCVTMAKTPKYSWAQIFYTVL